jgi:KaiC/GvpD/RAD55 family RecA-like ATPase
LIAGLDNLHEVFQRRYAPTFERLRREWLKNSQGRKETQDDIDTHRYVVEASMCSTIEDAIQAGFSEYDVARELFGAFQAVGYPVSPDEAKKRVAQFAAKLDDGMKILDDFDPALSGLDGAAYRALENRLAELELWSKDSAFLFGIQPIDDLTVGVQPGEIMTIAGAEGSLKTSLVLKGVENALSRGMTVMFYSLDMSKGMIQQRRMQFRLRCHETELAEMQRARSPEVERAKSEIHALDGNKFFLFGNDTMDDDITLEKLLHDIRLIMPNVLCVDYLTLLDSEEQNDLHLVNKAMRKLKKFSQAYKIRTVILNQMSRASKREQRNGVIGGHSRGGGAIEELTSCEIELFQDVPNEGSQPPLIATVVKNRRGPKWKSFKLFYEPKCVYITGEAVGVELANKKTAKPAFEEAARAVYGRAWAGAGA